MAAAVIDQRAVDLIADDGDAASAGEFQHRALIRGRHDPAGRVAGGGDENRPGAAVTGIEQLVQVQPPVRRARLPFLLQPGKADFGARHPGGLKNVRPHRGNDHDIVARLHHALQGRHHRQHRGPRHGDPLNADPCARSAGMKGGNRLAQGQDAARPGIESAALIQRQFGRLTDEGRGDKVALAEPQGNDVRVPQAQHGHPADAIGPQLGNGRADWGRWHGSALVRRPAFLAPCARPRQGPPRMAALCRPGPVILAPVTPGLRGPGLPPITPPIPHARVGSRGVLPRPRPVPWKRPPWRSQEG